MTPSDHISICGPIFLRRRVKSSGAIYFKEPTPILETSKLVAIPAIPKSTILIFLVLLSASRMFSNFKSRCINFWWWQYCMASVICKKNTLASASTTRPTSIVFYNISNTLQVLQQFTPLQVLHHVHNLHIRQRETIINLHDVTMHQWLQHLSLPENHINILHHIFIYTNLRITNTNALNDLYRNLLLCGLVLAQQHLAETTLTQHTYDRVMSQPTTRIVFFSYIVLRLWYTIQRKVDDLLVFEELDIILVDLNSLLGE